MSARFTDYWTTTSITQREIMLSSLIATTGFIQIPLPLGWQYTSDLQIRNDSHLDPTFGYVLRSTSPKGDRWVSSKRGHQDALPTTLFLTKNEWQSYVRQAIEDGLILSASPKHSSHTTNP